MMIITTGRIWLHQRVGRFEPEETYSEAPSVALPGEPPSELHNPTHKYLLQARSLDKDPELVTGAEAADHRNCLRVCSWRLDEGVPDELLAGG